MKFQDIKVGDVVYIEFENDLYETFTIPTSVLRVYDDIFAIQLGGCFTKDGNSLTILSDYDKVYKEGDPHPSGDSGRFVRNELKEYKESKKYIQRIKLLNKRIHHISTNIKSPYRMKDENLDEINLLLDQLEEKCVKENPWKPE